MNLFDRSKVALLGALDVILCRNVMIYFDAETQAAVIETFEEKLRPGGYLLLGHSESLINLSSSFELRHLRHDMVYRKPAGGEPPDDPGTPRPRRAARGRGGARREGARTDPRAGDRRLGVQPSGDHAHARHLAVGRGGRRGARRRGGAAQDLRAGART